MRLLFTMLFLFLSSGYFAQGDKHSLGLNLLMPNLAQIQYEYQVNDNFRLALGHSPLGIYPNQIERVYPKSFSFSFAAAHTLLRAGKRKVNKFLFSGGAFYGYDGDARFPNSRFLRESKDMTPLLAVYSVKHDYAFYAGVSYEFKVIGNFSCELFLNWYLFTNANYIYDNSFILRPIPLPAITFKRSFAKREVKNRTDDEF